MPGNIANAAPNGAMPANLCTAFSEAREYPVLSNQYHGGERQRSQLAQTSRRTYKLSQRLPAGALTALYNFLAARVGQAFAYYDPFDVAAGAIGANYDPTGANTQGRVTVVARGGWGQATDVCRSNVSIELVEVA